MQLLTVINFAKCDLICNGQGSMIGAVFDDGFVDVATTAAVAVSVSLFTAGFATQL